MKKHFKIVACYLRLNLASALEYRASFFTQAFGMALSNSSFIFFWWIAFNQVGGSIAGYTFEDVLFIWAVASSAFGLKGILFQNTSRLTDLIVTGEFDTLLLQPCNVLINLIFGKTSLGAYGDFFYGFVIMIIFYAGNFNAWLWFILGTIVGGIIFAAISLTAHTLSFYFGDTSAISQMATELAINFSVYPDRIYAPAVRALMYSVIPIGVAVHIPLRLSEQFSLPIALFALCVTILYSVTSGWFFYKGLRRYESGNLVITRQ